MHLNWWLSQPPPPCKMPGQHAPNPTPCPILWRWIWWNFSNRKKRVHVLATCSVWEADFFATCWYPGGWEEGQLFNEKNMKFCNPTKPLKVCNFQNSAFGIISNWLSANLNKDVQAMQSSRLTTYQIRFCEIAKEFVRFMGLMMGYYSFL